MTLVLQLVLPAGFWASQIKSPVSSVPRLFNCMTATESMNVIWYLSLAVSSCSFLYHTTCISGDPVILHSSRDESPAFTILDASNFFTNFGGSKGSGGKRNYERTAMDPKSLVRQNTGKGETRPRSGKYTLRSCVTTEQGSNRGTGQTETTDSQTCTPVTSNIVVQESLPTSLVTWQVYCPVLEASTE